MLNSESTAQYFAVYQSLTRLTESDSEANSYNSSCFSSGLSIPFLSLIVSYGESMHGVMKTSYCLNLLSNTYDHESGIRCLIKVILITQFFKDHNKHFRLLLQLLTNKIETIKFFGVLGGRNFTKRQI